MIKVTNLSVRGSGKTLLHKINLNINQGEVLGIVGPNGAGKSTLLKAMSGATNNFSGEIYFNQTLLGQWHPKALARLRAVVSQASHIPFPFTCLEIVMMGRYPYLNVRQSRKDRQIAQTAMRALGVEHLAQRFYPSLSGGEMQRVQIARALAQIAEPSPLGPRVLFLDEPTSHLDLKHQRTVLSLVKELSLGGVAVVIVLHDLNYAAQACDRIAMLQDGELRSIGAPADVFTKERIRAVFDIDTESVRHTGQQNSIVINFRQSS